MKREYLSLFKVVAVGMLLMAGLAVGPAQGQSSGVVHFGGIIEEDGCQVNVVNNQVHSSCYRDGKRQRVKHDIGRLYEADWRLPAQVGEGRLIWMDTAHTQALITVVYR
ncbi:hypothetical protein A9798_05680 [Edwardsiella hoshinae]|uniref:Type 1 fimbrial protein n=1 Tax=Edwardsiella hoshinae TaxID=93378 RepID=A0A376DC17_9GAMM|nr:hypothetical protein A9798_05680 [Edwardsiella hoshinae]STC86664.1 Uncharacterised protein [Edwardsiella hoshinae]